MLEIATVDPELEEAFLKKSESAEDPRADMGVYADWLEEQGDPRAEILRLAIEVRGYEPDTHHPLPQEYIPRYYPTPGKTLWVKVRDLNLRPTNPWCTRARLPNSFTHDNYWYWEEDYGD